MSIVIEHGLVIIIKEIDVEGIGEGRVLGWRELCAVFRACG